MERPLKAGIVASHRDRLPSSSQYELIVRIASGGMATVYVGRRSGAGGFSRLVAIKRAHAHLVEDATFSEMLVAEAKIAARIHHPNVVAVEAVEILEGEILLIMDYVEGAALSELLPRRLLPAAVVARIVVDACAGLHAAHTTCDDDGKPLGLVHRDISPQNILVGRDGIARVSDFGIAKSTGTDTTGLTASGTLKGKVGYMPPEYVATSAFDARSDVFALGVVAWEALTGRRLFRGVNEVETLRLVLATRVEAPSTLAPALPPAFDEVILRALARKPEARFASARELGDALEAVAREHRSLATAAEVGAEVESIAGAVLEHRRSLIRDNTAAGPAASSVRVLGRVEATDTHDIPAGGAPEGTASVDVEFTGASTTPQSLPAAEPTVTLGAGVSTQSLETARGDRPPVRGRGWVAAGVVALVVTGVGSIAALRPFRTSATVAPASTSPAESTTAAAPPTPPSPPPPPALEATALAIDAKAEPGPTPTTSASANRRTPEPRGAGPRAKPLRARGDSAKTDRAPPNPYGE